jgi:hypothetical protein
MSFIRASYAMGGDGKSLPGNNTIRPEYGQKPEPKEKKK